MSFQAMNWALPIQLSGPGEKAVLMALANYADENNDCFPSQERLARETCQGVRTVQRHLATLQERGLIVKRTRGGSGNGRWNNAYRLRVGEQPANLACSPPEGNPPSGRGLHATGGGSYTPPVAQEPLLEPPLEEPPPLTELRSVGVEALFDVPAKKPGRTADPVNVAAKEAADYWHKLTGGMANFHTARTVAVKALRAGNELIPVMQAMDRLHAAGRMLTAETLRIELQAKATTASSGDAPSWVYRDEDYWSDE